MRISELNTLGCQLSLSFGREDCSRPTTIDYPLESGLIFIKDAKFLSKFGEHNLDGKLKDYQMVALVDQKLWADLTPEHRSGLEGNLAGVWTAPDVEMEMCRISKIYYEKIFNDENDFVDGRQMGTADVHPTANIAQNVFIGANVTIEKDVVIYPGVKILSFSHIGEGTVLYPNVAIYQRVKIGKNVRIHSNSTIGADGFGYHFQAGVHNKIYHFGGVLVGHDVEVGANSCVDGGTFSPTQIGDGSKLDNHVQVGHNCQLGRGVIVCGHVAIGGSTHIGDYVVFGGKSGTGHGLNIGAQCEIAGGALVNCDWDAKTKLGGHPARPLREWMRGVAYIRKESLKK